MIKTFMENRWREIVMIEQANKKKELIKSRNANSIESTEEIKMHSMDNSKKPKAFLSNSKVESPNTISSISPTYFSIKEFNDQSQKRRQGGTKIIQEINELKRKQDKIRQKDMEENKKIDKALNNINRKRNKSNNYRGICKYKAISQEFQNFFNGRACQ